MVIVVNSQDAHERVLYVLTSIARCALIKEECTCSPIKIAFLI